MESGNWRGGAWPGPESRARQRLPRVEDLPAAENGYDRERVREAFESFYRHIAQLDSTLRALEAVEVFRDQAGELRKELRALKAAGWTQQPWPSYGSSSARTSPGLPESLPRFAIEAAFLIIVAVVVAVAGFDRLSIVLVMALAWAIVGVVEWASSRDRFARRSVAAPARAVPEPAEAPPLRIVSAESPEHAEAWEDTPAPQDAEDAEEADEELTVVGAVESASDEAEAEDAGPEAEAEDELVAVVADEEEPAVLEEPVEAVAEPEPEPEPEADAEVAEPEPEPEPEADAEVEEPESEPAAVASSWSWAADPAVDRAREHDEPEQEASPRRRFWQRRKREEDGYRFDPTQPRHVRVLPPAPSFDEQFPVEPADRLDPWEQELDLAVDEPDGAVEPEAEPGETEHAYAETRPDGDRVR